MGGCDGSWDEVHGGGAGADHRACGTASSGRVDRSGAGPVQSSSGVVVRDEAAAASAAGATTATVSVVVSRARGDLPSPGRRGAAAGDPAPAGSSAVDGLARGPPEQRASPPSR